MLQIVIVGSHADGRLGFTENGNPGNGHSRVTKGEDVHWKVHSRSGVDCIDDIRIKAAPGAPPSTNIFSNNPPREQANRKQWKSTSNANAQTRQEYNCNILWAPTTGGSAGVCDTKLTIKPSGGGVLPEIMGGAWRWFGSSLSHL